MTDRMWAAAILLDAALAGSALALGYRGDWRLAAVFGVLVLAPVAWGVRAELLATRDWMCGMPLHGRHRRRGQPRELRNVL